MNSLNLIEVNDFIERGDRISKNCTSVDGTFDLNKRYRFSYKKLKQDDRLHELTFAWINDIKAFDGLEIVVEDEKSGIIPNSVFSVARNWCEEIL